MKHLKLALLLLGVGGLGIVVVRWWLASGDYWEPTVKSQAEAIELARRFATYARIPTGQSQLSTPPQVSRHLRKGITEWGLS